jgi:hypothetical protein
MKGKKEWVKDDGEESVHNSVSAKVFQYFLELML